MAEILGVVASGIAVGQLAGSVTKSIFKLKDYWNQVHEASDDVRYLLREIDSLHLILCQIQEDQAQRSTGGGQVDNLCLRQSLELCREGAEELQEVADELAEKVEGNRGWRKKVGSVKVVLRKEDVKRLKKRMKNSVRLLSLSYQLHTNAMIQLQPDLIVARMIGHIEPHTRYHLFQNVPATLVGGSKAGEAATLSIQRQYDIWISSPSWISYVFGHLSYQKRTRVHRGRDVDDITASYKLPDFIANKVLNIQGNNALSGWRVNIRTYRVIPNYNPFFSAIYLQDLVTVRRLLADKEYFATDKTDVDEKTALHEAVQIGNVEICKLLLREGADPLAVSPIYNTPLHQAFEYGSLNTYLGRAATDINHLLLSEGGIDFLIDDPKILQYFRGSIEELQYLYQEIRPASKSELLFSAQTCITFAAKAAESRWLNTPLLIEYWLDLGCIENDVLCSWIDSEEQSLLHLCARSFAWHEDYHNEDHHGISLELDEGLSPELQRQIRLTNSNFCLWQRLIHRLLSAGSLPCAINPEGHTAFSTLARSLLYEYACKRKPLSELNATLRAWLGIIVQSGIDLLQHSEEETSSFLENKSWTCECKCSLRFPSGNINPCNKKHFFYRNYSKEPWHEATYPTGGLILSFSPGPRPEDWIFVIFAPAKAYAQDFSHMVEGDKRTSSYIPSNYEECSEERYFWDIRMDGESSDDENCLRDEEGSSLNSDVQPIPGSWNEEFNR